MDFCFGTEREKRGCVGIASRRSPLQRGAPVEASPQQRRRQQCCREQWHSNGSCKGIPATTAWHSLIAASSAFFLLSFYILLYRKSNRRSSHVNDTIISSNLFLSLSLCSCEDFKRNGDRTNFYKFLSFFSALKRIPIRTLCPRRASTCRFCTSLSSGIHSHMHQLKPR